MRESAVMLKQTPGRRFLEPFLFKGIHGLALLDSLFPYFLSQGFGGVFIHAQRFPVVRNVIDILGSPMVGAAASQVLHHAFRVALDGVSVSGASADAQVVTVAVQEGVSPKVTL
jgi:hypothetical protein